LHPIKNLEVLPHEKSPYARALTNFWVTLGKETKAFAALNNHVTQFARGCRILNANKPYNVFKVG